MSHRHVQGLVWARRASEAPFAELRRKRGRKAAGLRYERGLARAMRGVTEHGVWYEFQDRNGHGHCQVDLLCEHESMLVVLECKYTWTPEGHSQIERLYVPVVSRAESRPVRGVVVCKVLVPGMTRVAITTSLADACRLALGGSRVVWHWTGESALEPPSGMGRMAPIAPALAG